MEPLIIKRAVGLLNTDAHGWRFAPRGWTARRGELDPELEFLTKRIIGAE